MEMNGTQMAKERERDNEYSTTEQEGERKVSGRGGNEETRSLGER